MNVFQILTALLLLVFYGSYYAKKIAQRKKGIRTTQIGRGKHGVSLYTEIAMGIAAFCIVCVEIISIVHDRSASPVWVRILGLVIASLGALLFIVAMLTMRDSWRAGVSEDKTALVTGGIFQFSRNPAFLGFDLIYFGVFLVFSNWVLFLFCAFAILTLHLQIVKGEEPAMVAAFGEEYLRYRENVRRYLGRKR